MQPDQQIIWDDDFLWELDLETRELIEKENQRYKIAQEAADIEIQVYRDKIAADEATH